MIIHGNGGHGASILEPLLLGNCSARALLYATRYFIILPDGVGHGKPRSPVTVCTRIFLISDYDDMVHSYLLPERRPWA